MTIQDPAEIKQYAYREGYICDLTERGCSFLETDLMTWRNNLDSERLPDFLKSKYGHEG